MSVFPQTSAQPAVVFVEQSRAFLRDEYVPKILRCLGKLSEEDIWWRPNAVSNSVGNLVLHLCGNARQWIVAGVGGGHDIRVRSAEFAAAAGFTAETLSRLLETMMRDVDDALAEITPEVLNEVRTIQGFEMTVMQAIFHVVEHFSGHSGQIAYITKLRTAGDLGFYEAAADGSVKTTW